MILYRIEHAVTPAQWRTLDTAGGYDWTNDSSEALTFTMKQHAALFAVDDPDQVKIEEFTLVEAETLRLQQENNDLREKLTTAHNDSRKLHEGVMGEMLGRRWINMKRHGGAAHDDTHSMEFWVETFKNCGIELVAEFQSSMWTERDKEARDAFVKMAAFCLDVAESHDRVAEAEKSESWSKTLNYGGLPAARQVPIDHDLAGKPIYDPTDTFLRSLPVPIPGINDAPAVPAAEPGEIGDV